MKRIRSTLTVALVLAVSSVPVVLGAGWQEFRSAEGRFSVLLPGEPSREVKNTPTDAGNIPMHMFSCTTDTLYCSVTYNDVPAGVHKTPDVLLADACNGFVRGANLAEKSERRVIELNGNPGRELIAESADGKFVLQARYYLVNRRVYLIMVGTSVEDASSTDVGRVLDSFRVRQ